MRVGWHQQTILRKFGFGHKSGICLQQQQQQYYLMFCFVPKSGTFATGWRLAAFLDVWFGHLVHHAD
jgi:hypothetical protein